MGTVSVSHLSSSNHCYVGYDTGVDPYSPSVVLLLNMEGVVGSTTFLDESYTPRAIVNSGSVVYSDTTTPFVGGTSAAFSGSTGLRCGGDGFNDLVNSNFTMEVLANFTSLTSEPVICEQYNLGASTSWSFRVSATGVKFYWSVNGSTVSSVLFSSPVTLDVWHSIALVKNGTSLRCFLNGSPIGADQAVSNNIINSASQVYIGASSTNVGALTGYLKCLRISKTDRYVDCGVIPKDNYPSVTTVNPYNYYTSTVGDSLWGNNLLQLHFDGLDGAINMLDSGPYNRVHTPITDNMPFCSANQARFGYTSISFNPISTVPALHYQGPFHLSSLPLTISFWVYPEGTAPITGEVLFCLGPEDLAANGGILIVRGVDNKIDYYVGAGTGLGAWNLSATGHPSVVAGGQWSHIALVRTTATLSTAWTLYVNGVYQTNFITNFEFPPEFDIYLGGRSGPVVGGPVNYTGYMDEFVLTKNEKRYLTTFTPPTEPFLDTMIRDPFFRNVVLLVNGEPGVGGGAYFDDKSRFQWPLLSNSGLGADATYASHGFYAMAGSGTGDPQFLLYDTDSSLDLSPFGTLAGNQDFTIECFVKHETIVGFVGWVSRQNSLGTLGWYLATNAAGKATFVANVGSGMAVLLESPSALTSTINYHLAVTRQGNTLRLWVDGVHKDAYTLTTPFVDATGEGIRVGGSINDTLDISDTAKRIEEVRITMGVSRYRGTLAFTPVRAPFPLL